ncbi:MAG: HAMP domain-containing histidine kinase [Acidobacteria bacterium]|nr:HAMP domain-containing histidine kinase [Acidobacteriota bacterium]
MRRQGPLTTRHLIVAALTLVVINAQLTWWIIYALRENRTRLRLERGTMLAECSLYEANVGRRMAAARAALEEALANSVRVPAVAPPPFASIDGTGAAPCSEGWTFDDGVLKLHVSSVLGCIGATASADWTARLLDPPEGCQKVAATDSTIPGITLPRPLDSWQVRPQEERWHKALTVYQGRILMMVSEGSFFVVLLLIMLGLLWRTFRREVELERQHQGFLSAITHELKSPLASVRLALETLLRGRADGNASMHFLENALQDTERLQSLVQKVLEVTRYARGHAALRLRRTNLSALVEDTARTFLRRATSAGARLETEIEPGLWAEVDDEALPIALSNLLENAIKYGGTVPTVTVSLTAEGGSALIRVIDNGHGIPDDDVQLVFDRFFRGGNEMTRTTQGTGLGLHLVQQIVRAHRGTVRVASTGTDGTTFLITLPHVEIVEEQA